MSGGFKGWPSAASQPLPHAKQWLIYFIREINGERGRASQGTEKLRFREETCYLRTNMDVEEITRAISRALPPPKEGTWKTTTNIHPYLEAINLIRGSRLTSTPNRKAIYSTLFIHRGLEGMTLLLGWVDGFVDTLWPKEDAENRINLFVFTKPPYPSEYVRIFLVSIM